MTCCREERIETLTRELADKDETVSKMVRAVIKYKNRLATIELEAAKFVVEKVYQFYPNSTAQVPSIALIFLIHFVKLLVIQNPTTKAVHFDLVVNGKRHAYSVDDIVSIGPIKSDKYKFSFTMKVHSLRTNVLICLSRMVLWRLLHQRIAIQSWRL